MWKTTARTAALLLLATGCSSAADRAGGAVTTTRPADTVTTTTSAVPAKVDRLVVVDGDGAIATVRPDGSDRRRLTAAASSRLQFLQPTWSPDASRLAWTEVDATGSTVAYSVVVAGPEGDEVSRTGVPFPPFYMYWSPTSSRLAYLGSGERSLELGILDPAAGTAETVDAGQPYYFSWSPQGNELLVHVGSTRLERLTPGGSTEAVGPTPGVFQAPVWSRNGSVSVYVAEAGGAQELVVDDGATRDTVVRFDGFASFVLSPDGTRLAYQVAGAVPDGVTASATVLASYRAQGESPGLTIYALDTGRTTTVTTDPAVAFFFSPDGAKLLSYHPDRGVDGLRLHWRVWQEDADDLAGDSFRPTSTLLGEYLPFFDQYAQSLTFWAPDSDAFTYAALDEDGEPAVWIQSLEPGVAPRRVSMGSFAAWSPA